MIPGLRYIPNFITQQHEDMIVADIDSRPWSEGLKRRVQHYGYEYNYLRRQIDVSMKAAPLVPWMVAYSKLLVKKGIFLIEPDQVIMNEYEPGQGIFNHIDCPPCFKDNIISISLLSGCLMQFHKGKQKLGLYLEPRSLLLLSGEARYEWTHGIPARKKDGDIPRSRRISATFRTVILGGY